MSAWWKFDRSKAEGGPKSIDPSVIINVIDGRSTSIGIAISLSVKVEKRDWLKGALVRQHTWTVSLMSWCLDDLIPTLTYDSVL